MRKVKVHTFLSRRQPDSSCEPRESDDSESDCTTHTTSSSAKKSLDILVFFTPSQINLHGQFRLGKGHPMLVTRSAMCITYILRIS